MDSRQHDAAQPRMLLLARESRKLTQKQLCEAIKKIEGPGSKVSQAYVSRAEAGQLSVSGERLALYARALGYPASLLSADAHEFGAGPGLVHHRKKQSATAGDLRRIHALLNLTRIQVSGLLAGVLRTREAKIQHFAVDDLVLPDDAARWVRAEWGVPPGPLDSVVALIEKAGVLVLARELVAPAPLDSGAEAVPVDAVSCSPAGEDPLVLLNVGTPGERQRFTLAHELGHMLMHPVPHPDQETQANRFAAELLLPRAEIRKQLRGPLSVPRLMELKAHWKVSMWALLRRARTLGCISDWQYRTLAVEMSSLGYRTVEPVETDVEQPAAVPALIGQHLANGRNVEDLAAAAHLYPGEFAHLYMPASLPHVPSPADRLIAAFPAPEGVR